MHLKDWTIECPSGGNVEMTTATVAEYNVSVTSMLRCETFTYESFHQLSNQLADLELSTTINY